MSTYVYESYWDDLPPRTALSTEEVQALLDAACNEEEWLRILRWVGPPPRCARTVRPKPPSPFDSRAVLMGQKTESLHRIRRGGDVDHVPAWRKSAYCRYGVISRGGRTTPKLSDDNPWAGTTYLNRASPRRRKHAEWRNNEDSE